MAGAATLLIFAACSLLQEFSLVEGFKWTHTQESAESFTRCVGQEVTFPWDFELEDGESILGIAWSRVREGQKENIAEYLFNKFKSKIGPELTQVKSDGPGIKLADLTTADSGTYEVLVRLRGGQDVFQQSIPLTVAEIPETETGSLVVILSNKTQTETSTSARNGYQQLLCGRFISLGVPAVSVVWEDPSGYLLESTSFDTSAGYFILNLPTRHRGGSYKCMINETGTAFSCLDSASPLRQKASLVVSAPASQTRAAGLDSGTVAGIVIGVLAVVATAIIITLVVVLKLYRRRGKKYSPKEPDSPSPDQEVTEPFKT